MLVLLLRKERIRAEVPTDLQERIIVCNDGSDKLRIMKRRHRPEYRISLYYTNNHDHDT
ncbi:MAG: hypothetical protein JWL77_2690 [Chthonomonadaceae bacterium]|nr:hypothetical protein [Chthonomonadaceae bacterium]